MTDEPTYPENASIAEVIAMDAEWCQDNSPESYDSQERIYQSLGDLHPLTVGYIAEWPSGVKSKMDFCPEEGQRFVYRDLSVASLDPIYYGECSGQQDICFDGFTTLEELVDIEELLRTVQGKNPGADLAFTSYKITEDKVIFS